MCLINHTRQKLPAFDARWCVVNLKSYAGDFGRYSVARSLLNVQNSRLALSRKAFIIFLASFLQSIFSSLPFGYRMELWKMWAVVTYDNKVVSGL